MEIEEGASVVFCSTLDAAYTLGTSSSASASNESSVGSSFFGADLASSAEVPSANKMATTPNKRQRTMDQGIAPMVAQGRGLVSRFICRFETISLAESWQALFARVRKGRLANVPPLSSPKELQLAA